MQPAHPRSKPAWFRQRRRLGCRLATGMSPARAARAEGLPEAELDAMLRDPDFAELVEAYRALDALEPKARLARLERLAMLALERAVEDGDARVAMFIIGQRRQGLDPARTIALRVAKACAQAAAPPEPRPEPKPAKPRPPRPYDPLKAALRRGAARVCLSTAIEHELRATTGSAPAPVRPASPVPPARPVDPTRPAPAASRPAPRSGGWPRGP